jgi:hypothetical protein
MRKGIHLEISKTQTEIITHLKMKYCKEGRFGLGIEAIPLKNAIKGLIVNENIKAVRMKPIVYYIYFITKRLEKRRFGRYQKSKT